MKIMDSEASMDVDLDSVLSFTSGTKICPLCNGELKFFFINLLEKFLMCENTECDYPFGHTELQFVKLSTYSNKDDDSCSISSQCTITSTPCSSVVSNIAWADIERMNRLYESDTDSQLEHSINSSSDRDNVLLKSQQMKESEDLLKKNVADIKELSVELKKTQYDAPPRLQNTKWIQNLMRVQELSGVKLLADDEVKKLQKPAEPELGLGELTIDIAAKDDQMSSIKIQINKPTETTSVPPS